MKLYRLYSLSLFMAMCHFLSAQSVGIGTPTPNPKAILDLESSNKGLLLPRLIDTAAVSAPVPAGLTIYSTSDKKVYFYDGTIWQRSSAQTASDGLWYEKNDSILYTDRKYVGVNTNLGLLPPQANLQVNGSLLVQGDYTYTVAVPTPAQTYTMDNTTYQTVPQSDSIFRIFDTGGSANYLVNTQGNVICGITSGQIGSKISFNENDFGIAVGDTLWTSTYTYPQCRTNYLQMWTNTTLPPTDFIINGTCNFIFRSNNSIVGSGFDITVTRIFVNQSYQAIQLIGSNLMYDANRAVFRVGVPSNESFGYGSAAIGMYTTASGGNSTAMGSFTTASGQFSTAMGQFSKASNNSSTALGFGTTASGYASTAMGNTTTALGYGSTAMGDNTLAPGDASTAMGNQTKASGYSSTAMGNSTTAKSYSSLAIGQYNDTIVGADPYSWIPTDPLLMVGNGSGANARSNAMTVYKNGTFDLQNHTTTPANSNNKYYVLNNEPYFSGKGLASQLQKITEGGQTGWRLLSSDPNNYGDIGDRAIDLSYSPNPSSLRGATGYSSTCMGYNTQASGSASTATGEGTTASGTNSTAMGYYTIASGYVSTSIGSGTQASGSNSIAMGLSTQASGINSTTMGTGTTAKSYSSLAIGQYNDTIVGSNPYTWIPTDPIFMVGKGFAPNARSNAMTVYKNGNTDISGFTRLGTLSEGAPRIKHKKITLNSPNSDGGIISTSHGLTYSKILSATAVLDFGAGSITPGYRYSNGFEYSLSYDVNLVYISNQSGNSANILDKPVKIIITYEE